jgi:hypothetical protein
LSSFAASALYNVLMENFSANEFGARADAATPLPAAVADALAPHRFYARGVALSWTAALNEEISWEVFRGRLLDPAHTRQRRRFLSWNVHQLDGGIRSPEPLLSVKADEAAGVVHVVRALPCYAFEAYDAGDNVILSREVVKWVRELVGTIRANELTPAELRDELTGLVWQAIIGTSRLPLTSVEAPLPAFTFGQLAYLPWADESAPPKDWPDLIRVGLTADKPAREPAKLLEFLLRTVPRGQIGDATRVFAQRWNKLGRSAAELTALWRTMFNDVSLSPYTDFVDNSLGFLRLLAEQGFLERDAEVDALAALLLQLGRHLTAYDLITFHHRGANYPDALLLDAALKRYLSLAEYHPAFFDVEPVAKGRRRRRALRQACLLRHFYEGHAVPDAPTSPGENARVLPPPHVRVPDEQILQPATRRRRLYAGDPLTALLGAESRRILQAALTDVACPAELRELGMAVFIERPLGAGKLPGEPDQTPLLAHAAFSRKLATSRAHDLIRFVRDMGLADVRETRFLEETGFLQETRFLIGAPGVRVTAVWTPERATVSLADARRVADDFILLRTLPAGINDLLRIFPLAEAARRHGATILDPPTRVVIIRVLGAAANPLAIFDDLGRKRLELEVDLSKGFHSRGSLEYPAAGLRLASIWTESGEGLREVPVSDKIAPLRPVQPRHA